MSDAPLHLVDPELLPGLQNMPPLGLALDTLPLIRDGMTQMFAGMLDTRPELGTPVETSEIVVSGPTDSSGVRMLTYRPATASGPLPAYLHIHGGGYVLGAPEVNHLQNLALAADANCFVASVDYRLAPETPYPGSLEDCYAALKWIHTAADDLGLDTERVAVGGESAGGGLAAALALLARDRGEHRIHFQCLTFPMIDDRTCVTPDPNPNTGHHLWTNTENNLGWTALLGREPGGSDVSPYAAAARATDLSGLPSTLILVGALDLLVDENMEFARRLIRAGVPTELHVYPGAFHAFELFAEAGVTKAMLRDRLAATRRAFRHI